MALIGRCADDAPWIFLHIPKTGGTWFSQAITASAIAGVEQIGWQHIHFPQLSDHIDEYTINVAEYIVLVRHPITWYQSRWAFRVAHGWKMEHPIDYECASNDFVEWVENLLRYKPNGWVTELYSNYIDSIPSYKRNICYIEDMIDSTLSAIDRIGIEIDRNEYINTPIANNTCLGGRGSKYWARYPEYLFDAVMEVEADAIALYYNDFAINKDEFCGDTPY